MILLRDAVEADLQRLFDLDQICFPAGVAYSLGDFRSLLRSRKTVSVVAEEDTVLAGFSIAQRVSIRTSQGGHIVTIDVAPEFRRRGVGRMLMGLIERRMRDSGANSLRLEVAVNNFAALNFYAGHGFDRIGEIPGYYRGALDAIVMEKTLAERANPSS
jgi:ribosomal-protein-alanine N-acetyltransferase